MKQSLTSNWVWQSRLASSALLLTGFFTTLPLIFAQGPPQFTIKNWAGNGSPGFAGDGGTATDAQLNSPFGIALDSSGNLYIADQVNNRIRRRGADGSISTVAGDGTASYAGDGSSATKAQLFTPCGVFVDASGTIFIADTGNSTIRKFTNGGNISLVAGKQDQAGLFTGDGAAATSAGLSQPRAVLVDKSGVVYIADSGNDRIRTVSTSGTITTFAGNGAKGYSGDTGAATDAALYNPQGLALDAAGNLYIADTNNHVVRKVGKDGIISTIAGTGSRGYSGDGGLATKALLNFPTGVAVDAAGTLYIVDSSNHRIRVVTPTGSIFTVAGTGSAGDAADGAIATDGALRLPIGIAVDTAGAVYISDTQNHRVRRLAPLANVDGLPVIRPDGVLESSAFGAFPTIAPATWIEIWGDRLASEARAWGASDFTGDTAPTSLAGTSVSINGRPLYLSYVSPQQINALVPRAVCSGLCQLTVTTAAGSSARFSVTIKNSQPGLLAPPVLKIDDQQYVGAIAGDGITYILPEGTNKGVPSRPARPGEVITLFGIGFGTVDPFVDTGDRFNGATSLNSALKVFFGNTQAVVSYAGLLPGAISLYQFNVIVPDMPDSNSVPLSFSLDGNRGTQALYAAVKK